MIAELSEQKQEDPKEMAISFTASQQIVERSEIEQKHPPKKVIKKSPKNEKPKSSFAAWKLAKGRKNQGSKNVKGKEAGYGKAKQLSVAMESKPPSTVRTEIVVTPTSPTTDFPGGTPMALMAAAIEMKASARVVAASDIAPSSSLAPSIEALATAAAKKKSEIMTASAPSLPPKKALKRKAASTKKSPKKGGSSVKNNDEGKKMAKKAKDGNAKRKSKKGQSMGMKTSPFPEKIMELLQGNLASNAIYWLPEGEAIAVDPDSFKDSPAISKQFRGNKLSSFVRSLNRWGFRRIFYHSLPDKTLAFYHRLFQKHSPLLVKEMKMDGGEKEPALPPGALPMLFDGNPDMGVEAEPKPEESATTSRSMMTNHPLVATPVESTPMAPGVVAPARVIQVAATPERSPPLAAAAQFAHEQVPGGILTAAAAAQPGATQSYLDHVNALELAESQHALQQAMIAEQERSDSALQQLQAQQFLLQALAEQQNAAHAEEFLMQSMLAEHHRSNQASQQRHAEQALLQQMVAEEQTAALAAALGGGSNAEAVLRERLLAQHFEASAPAPGTDFLAMLQNQLQGGQQQQQAREPSYMEQLLLLEQQRQRQAELELLAAHGFRF
jgi:HSF-type DNA-binding